MRSRKQGGSRRLLWIVLGLIACSCVFGAGVLLILSGSNAAGPPAPPVVSLAMPAASVSRGALPSSTESKRLLDQAREMQAQVDQKLRVIAEQSQKLADLQRQVVDAGAKLLQAKAESAENDSLKAELRSLRAQLANVKREQVKYVNANADKLLAAESNGVQQPRAFEEHDMIAKSAGGATNNVPLTPMEEFMSRKYVVVPKRGIDSIFVSLASFGDPLCPQTLTSILTQAENPSRVIVGVVQQNAPTDDDCVEVACKRMEAAGSSCPRANIRVIRMSKAQSRGVAFARWLATTLVDGEDFFFQVDSHTDFIKGWDRKVLSEWRKLPYERTVLSAHPPAVGQDMVGRTVNLCSYAWQIGIPRFSGQHFEVVPMGVRGPFPGMFFGAGFVFAPTQMLDEVPYDPYLQYVFQGEELLYAVRLWTTGWDIWTPTFPLVYHHYKRPSYGRAMGDAGAAVDRVLVMVGVKPMDAIKSNPTALQEYDRYGMGKERTVESWWKVADIDWRARDNKQSWCNVQDVISRLGDHHHGWKPDYAWLSRDQWINTAINHDL